MVDAANQMAVEVQQPNERDRDSFGIYVVKKAGVTRAWVHPMGRTGLHIEAGHSVLLKAISMVR